MKESRVERATITTGKSDITFHSKDHVQILQKPRRSWSVTGTDAETGPKLSEHHRGKSLCHDVSELIARWMAHAERGAHQVRPFHEQNECLTQCISYVDVA